MSRQWTIQDLPSQAGRRIIVTGANSGIGWHTALELARAGAEVTVAARSLAKAEDAAARIHAEVPAATLRTGVLDLTDPGSVDAFAQEQLRATPAIDTLVNNAGVMALPRRENSVDGHERQFATNVLGPFRLTGLLLPALLRGKAPRVVTVSSFAHTIGGPVPIVDLDSTASYQPIRAYAKTKLANILFTRALQRRAGDRPLATTCHPGASHTNLGAAASLNMRLMGWAVAPIMQAAAMGAEPTLMAATHPHARPGGYYGPGGLFKLRGHPVEMATAPFANDVAAAERLFDELEHLSGVHYAL